MPRSASSWICSSYDDPFSSAFWKIVGFVVTPTTCLSRIRLARLPLTRRSRERSSSQIATPWADRSARTSLIAEPPAIADSVAGGGAADRADLGQRRMRRRHDPVAGEAELLVDHLVIRARAE